MSAVRLARVVPYDETGAVLLATDEHDLRPALDAAALVATRAHPWATLRAQGSDAFRVSLDDAPRATPRTQLREALSTVTTAARKALESRGFTVIGRLM